jgi:GAF domain-containing protein
MPSSELIQMNSTNLLTVSIAIFGLLLIVGVVVFMVFRSKAQKREEDARARERLREMERISQFEAAVDRVRVSHSPVEVASEVAMLFRDYLSMPLLALYGGRESDAALMDLLSTSGSSKESKPASLISTPACIESSIIQQTPQAQPAKLSALRRAATAVTGNLEPSSGALDGDADLERSESEIPEENVFDDVILVPWKGTSQWNGLIVIDAFGGIKPEALEPYNEAIARLTDKLSFAFEFEQSEATLEALNQHAERTTEFSRSVIACLEDQAPMESIVRHVTELVDSDSAALWRMDQASGMIRMVAAYGLRSSEFLPLPLGQGLAGHVAQSGHAIALDDAPSDPRCIFPREARESGITSYMAAPLSVGGRTLGVIEAHTSNRRTWAASEQLALESAAAIITELLRTTDTSRDRLRVETAYLGLSEALQRLRTADEVKEAVVEVLGHALSASRVIVVEFDEHGKPQPVMQEYKEPTAKSAVGAVFTNQLLGRLTAETEEGLPLPISDASTQSLMGTETAESLGVMSELILPIRVEGKTRAIIYVHQCDREREWDKEEIDFADRVARQLSLSLSNLRSLQAAFSDADKARADARLAETIAHFLPEIVIGIDPSGKLSYFNAAAGDRLGLTGGDLQRAISEIKASAMLEQQAWDTVLGCDKALRFDSKITDANRRQDMPARVAAAPLCDESGVVTGRIMVVTELGHLEATSVSARISELEKKLDSYERVLSQSRAAEEEARGMLARASALEAKARAEVEVTRRAEADVKNQLALALESQKQAQGSAQQLLEINRLKSEFIVNAGHEIEASLQSVLGLAELLEGGTYGSLTPEQRETVQGIYSWARRMKSDVDWLVEYGSTRSRRLETSGGG